MKKITMPVAKTATQELSGDQLEELVAFGKGETYKLLQALADREKYLRYREDILGANSVETINFLKGVNLGMDYIMDSVNRAKEELKNRKVEVDTED
jgi:hypothetical protein